MFYYYDSNIVMFCEKFPNGWANEIDVKDEVSFARFEFKSFSHTATPLRPSSSVYLEHI